eukprot:3524782-Amphidinium_carterae.1
MDEVQKQWLTGPLRLKLVSDRRSVKEGAMTSASSTLMQPYPRRTGWICGELRSRSLGGGAHSSFTDNRRLQRRCLDLTSAYKQLALQPGDRCNAAISAFYPTLSRCEWFVANVLPFRARGLVVQLMR